MYLKAPEIGRFRYHKDEGKTSAAYHGGPLLHWSMYDIPNGGTHLDPGLVAPEQEEASEKSGAARVSQIDKTASDRIGAPSYGACS